MPFEVVSKEQRIANCMQFECQLKLQCYKEQVDCKLQAI